MGSRRVLHFAPLALHTPHTETDLELIQEELRRGAQVFALVCRASLLACESNLDQELATCAMCVARRREGFGLLDRAAGALVTSDLLRLTAQDRARVAALPARFSSLAELRAFTFDGFDAGMGVLSTLASLLRDPQPDVGVHEHTIRALLRSSCATYLSTRRWISHVRPHVAYVFNGRFASHRAFLRACQADGVSCSTHERGSTLDRYELFPDALPHDRALWERRIRASWERAHPAEARAIGARFYEDRARGVVYSYHAFTREQQPGLLPEPWPADRKKVAVFLSSENEFVAIGPDWSNPLYEGQWEGLFAILRELQLDSRFHVYVRCHPNSTGTLDKSVERLNELGRTASNVTVVPASSPVSSYDLLKSADRVITFGSTIGVEATYWGKPSILAGTSLYRSLEATYNPETHEALLALVRAPELAPRERDRALMFGYHLATFGIPFVNFEPDGVHQGRFRGRALTADHRVQRVARRLRALPVAGRAERAMQRVFRVATAARVTATLDRSLGSTGRSVPSPSE